MAHGARGAVGPPSTQSISLNDNGVMTATNPPAAPSINRKKQKRRQKQAAKAAAEQDHIASTNSHASNGVLPRSHGAEAPVEDAYAAQDQYDDDAYYTDDDVQTYPYPPNLSNGHYAEDPAAADAARKNKKKKKKKKSTAQDPYLDQSSTTYHPSTTHNHPLPSSVSKASFHNAKHNHDRDRIWNTSTQEERERIKEFWLDLGEDERKSLVKIEKEAVLRKMKEQQKHSCSCTVCGRKRTAIEEELEVLYDAYYDELEQFGSLQHSAMYAATSRSLGHHDRLPPDRTPPPQPLQGQIEELPDEVDEDEEEDEDELYSDEDGYEDEYSDDEAEGLSRQAANEFLNFGNSLTVKGGILTVADDLLKNDGKKFIEMMEQLAERRMAREEEAQSAAGSHPSSYHGGYPHNHPPEDDDYDEEDEEDYDSQEEFDEEDDDMEVMTEEQRMEEGRRMFQIFAARMFEQRVLTAYREKVARERQQKLLEELEEEKTHDVQREAKKARDAQKKKEKKALQKQKQAEEKARKEAEKAAEEAAVKAAAEKLQEEQRKKKEEQKKKKEAERKAQEEERQRKEGERLKRQQEERDRQQEAERKAREQKAAEKKAREELKRKEREGREAKEREVRDRKAQAEKEKKEREDKVKADKEVQDRARREAVQATHSAHQATQMPKRPSAPMAMPLPPGLSKQPSNVSPHVPVATPALPKAPTPVRARQGSQQGSKGSSPKTPSVAASQGKSGSPIAGSQQPPIVPKTILQKPSVQTQNTGPTQVSPASPLHSMAPPPGMPMPQTSGFGLPPGLNGFAGAQGGVMAGMAQRGTGAQNNQMIPQQGSLGQFRPFGAPGSAAGPPPGISGPNVPFGRGFTDAPPGLAHQFSGIGGATPGGMFSQIGRDSVSSTSGPGLHSRQTSFEQKAFEPAANISSAQPIARPVAPSKQSAVGKFTDPSLEDKVPDVDDITRHLGSSALLDDSDEPIPLGAGEAQRTGAAPGLMRGGSNLSNLSNVSAFGGSPIFNNPTSQPRMDSFGMGNTSNPSSTWSTPPMPFGQGGLAGAPNWGSSPTGGWSPATNSLGGFGMGMGTTGSGHRRPVQIRINICNTCRQLMAAKATNADGFVDAVTVLRHVQDMVHPPVQLEELLDFCETEGNASNGGGNFQVVKRPDPLQSLIKFEADQPSVPAPRTVGAGDIGSPSVGASLPGGPFGSMRGYPFGALSGQ